MGDSARRRLQGHLADGCGPVAAGGLGLQALLRGPPLAAGNPRGAKPWYTCWEVDLQKRSGPADVCVKTAFLRLQHSTFSEISAESFERGRAAYGIYPVHVYSTLYDACRHEIPMDAFSLHVCDVLAHFCLQPLLVQIKISKPSTQRQVLSES